MIVLFVWKVRTARPIVRTVAHLTAKKKGFSFQQARFTYNSPVPLLVLPSEWFDPAWVHGVDFCAFFKKSKAATSTATIACKHARSANTKRATTRGAP